MVEELPLVTRCHFQSVRLSYWSNNQCRHFVMCVGVNCIFTHLKLCLSAAMHNFKRVKAGALVLWLKLPAWKVVDPGFKFYSVLHVSFPISRIDSILLGTSVTEMWRARPQTDRAREFWILCPECSVISFISPSWRDCQKAQFSLYVHKYGL